MVHLSLAKIFTQNNKLNTLDVLICMEILYQEPHVEQNSLFFAINVLILKKQNKKQC